MPVRASYGIEVETTVVIRSGDRPVARYTTHGQARASSDEAARGYTLPGGVVEALSDAATKATVMANAVRTNERTFLGYKEEDQ